MSDIWKELRAIAQDYREPDSLGPILSQAADDGECLRDNLIAANDRFAQMNTPTGREIELLASLSHERHKRERLQDEVDRAKTSADINASLLSRQCDAARTAETETMRLTVENKVLRDECNTLSRNTCPASIEIEERITYYVADPA